MIFYSETGQPAAARQVAYTVTAQAIAPVQAQYGGVQGEHRATRLKFTLDPAMESWFEALLSSGQMFCRIDACDGSGEIHRSLPLEMAGEFADFSTIYYDLEQPVTRCGGFVKVCLVFSLLNGENRTWEKVKSYYALLELDASPTYSEEDYIDMTGLYQQTQAYAEAAETAAGEAETAQSGAQAAAASAVSAAQSAEEEAGNAQGYAQAAAGSAALAEGHAGDAGAYADDAEEAAAGAAMDKAAVTQMKESIEGEFSAKIVTSAAATATVTLADNTEYRYSTALTSLTLTLPSGLGAEDGFHALLSFKTPAESDIVLTYTTAGIYFTNDDCENGVFIPIRNKQYDVAVYWNGSKYQGMVRGVAV